MEHLLYIIYDIFDILNSFWNPHSYLKTIWDNFKIISTLGLLFSNIQQSINGI